MGNSIDSLFGDVNCDNLPKPDFSNVCDSDVNDINHLVAHKIENSCLEIGNIECNSDGSCSSSGPNKKTCESAKENLDSYCKKISNEWGEYYCYIQDNKLPQCSYVPCKDNGLFAIGGNYECGRKCKNDEDCKVDCGTSAFGNTHSNKQAYCVRKSFEGDPTQCCINDYNCLSEDILCFSDSDKKKTCANGNNGQPNYRNLTSKDCETPLFNYCLGNDLDSESLDWLDRWNKPIFEKSCTYFILREVFSDPNIDGTCEPILKPAEGFCNIDTPDEYNSDKLLWAYQLLNQLNEKYEKLGYKFGAVPGSRQYHPLQENIFNDLCCPFPLICQTLLKDSCKNLSSNIITKNKELNKWCGCHLPKEQYQDYATQFNIDVPCTPMCNQPFTIPNVKKDGEVLRCDKTICIINDITLNIVNSNIGGNINFDQICASST